MVVNINDIGNEISINLDKSFVKKYNFDKQVNVVLLEDGIFIKNHKSRDGWGNEFALMHQNGEDSLLIDDVFLDDILVDDIKL